MNLPQTTTPPSPPAWPSPPPKPTSVAAVVSLVAGVLCWIMLPLLGAIAAIIAGHMARGEIRRNPGMEGEGFALAGLILGYVQLLVLVLTVLAFVLFFGGLAVLVALFG